MGRISSGEWVFFTSILFKDKSTRCLRDHRFEAFDEPWKKALNEPGKEWEDKWGLMDLARNLKPGVKIPDCAGKTIDS